MFKNEFIVRNFLETLWHVFIMDWIFQNNRDVNCRLMRFCSTSTKNIMCATHSAFIFCVPEIEEP